MGSDETQFKPGNPGGPGRPPLPEDLKRARKLNKVELERLLNVYLQLTSEEIAMRMSEKETPMLEKMIASIVTKAVDHGDQQRLNFLLDRLVGKVKDEVDVALIPRRVIIERHDGTEIEMTAEVPKLEDNPTR